MDVFLQSARLKIAQFDASSVPELEIRTANMKRAELIPHLMSLIPSIEGGAAKVSFLQRCDIYYGATSSTSADMPVGMPHHQCRVTCRGLERVGLEFMLKETVLEVTENDDLKRKFVLAREVPLHEEVLPSELSQCFLKTRCLVQFHHWRVEFVASHRVPMLTIREIASHRNIYFAKPITTIDEFAEFVNNPIYVFQTVSIEYELIEVVDSKAISPSKSTYRLYAPDQIASIYDEFKLIDSIIFEQDTEAIRYRAILREAAGYYMNDVSHINTLKKATLQAKAMTSEAFTTNFPFHDWFLTEKTDGTHALLYAAANGGIYLLGVGLTELVAASASTGASSSMSATYLVDGELVEIKREGQPVKQRFVIFDVLVSAGIPLHNKPFSDRLGAIPGAVEWLQGKVGSTGVGVATKTFTRLTDYVIRPEAYVKQIDAILAEARLHEDEYATDGLMYMSPSSPYATTLALKWKPSSHATIDFLVRRVPDEFQQRNPFRLVAGKTQYVLYCTIYAAERMLVPDPPYVAHHFRNDKTMNTSRYPTPFQSSLGVNLHIFYDESALLDGQIVELAPTWLNLRGEMTEGNVREATSRLGWRFVRTRPDRKKDLLAGEFFGNAWLVAEQTLLTFVFPLTLSNLKGDMEMYFRSVKEERYKAFTGFNNFVKTYLWKTHVRGSSMVLDLAGGRGSDIENYLECVSQRIYVVERDEIAIQSLVSRKHSIYSDHSRAHRGRQQEPTVGARKALPGIFIAQQDLTRPAAETLIKLEILGAPKSADLDTSVIQPVSAAGTAKGRAVTQLGFDAVTCFFAMHYLTTTPEHIMNFATLVAHALKPGGVFIFTMFNHERVNRLLDEALPSRDVAGTTKEKGEWLCEEEGRKKYHIRRVTTAEAAPMIELILPFTQGKMISEYLINVDLVIATFAKFGFVVRERFDFDQKFSDVAGGFVKKADLLSPGDKRFVSLNMAVVLAAPLITPKAATAVPGVIGAGRRR